MENSNNAYARLWLRTSARSLLQCHKQLLSTDEQTNSNDDFLSQIKTYLDQLEVSELIEVIHHLTNEIGKQCIIDEAQEKKILCYRGVTTSYDPPNKDAIETPNTNVNEPSQKKKVRYYRGVPIEY